MGLDTVYYLLSGLFHSSLCLWDISKFTCVLCLFILTIVHCSIHEHSLFILLFNRHLMFPSGGANIVNTLLMNILVHLFTSEYTHSHMCTHAHPHHIARSRIAGSLAVWSQLIDKMVFLSAGIYLYSQQLVKEFQLFHASPVFGVFCLSHFSYLVAMYWLRFSLYFTEYIFIWY
jgi:hypothetical protein